LPATLALSLTLTLQLASVPALTATLALATTLTLRSPLTLRSTLTLRLFAAAFAAVLFLLGLGGLLLRHNDPRILLSPGFGLYRARRGGNPHRRAYKENCVSSAYYGHFLAFRWIGHRQSCAKL
jgi:hypothetical protein